MLLTKKTSHVVVCDTCGAVRELVGVTFDAAFDEARSLDWLDHAKKGKGRARWEWSCPVCRPRGGGSLGGSVGAGPSK